MTAPVLLLWVALLGTGTDDVTVYGNHHTRLSLLRRELRSGWDSTATTQALLADRRWLIRQRWFQKVDVTLFPSGDVGIRDVVWTVQERGRLSLAPLLSLDSRHGLSAGLEATIRNPRGRMTRWQAGIQIGGQPKATLRVVLPQSATALGLYAEAEAVRNATDYRYPDADAPFSWTVDRTAFTLGRRWGRRLETQATVGWRSDRCGVGGATFGGDRTESSVLSEALIRLDTRDWPAYPKSGWMAELFARRIAAARDLSVGWFGGTLRCYRPLGKSNILAMEAEGQWADGPAPLIHKLRLGGGDSIRGLRTGDLSGDHRVSGSVELRVPVVALLDPEAGLSAGWGLVFFADAGSVWAYGTKPIWRHAAGLGVHAIWDTLVLRAEMGLNGRGGAFVSASTGVKF